MLSGLHFLLTYSCTHQCDHCFLFSAPGAGGTFTVAQIEAVLDEAVRLGCIDRVCFEGGEPTLYFPVMREGIRLARRRGIGGGVVTNAYWALSEEDAELWLRPLAELGLDSASVSDDDLHYDPQAGVRAARVKAAAERLGMSAKVLETVRPRVEMVDGKPAVRGTVMFRGRAAVNLAPGMPTRPWSNFTKCTHEDLANPKRIHVDCYGNAHLCQGLSMGNFWETPLADLVRAYDGEKHPIAGPLIRGGPARLIEEYGLPHADEYVDDCHLCFEARVALRQRFPGLLAPARVYGRDEAGNPVR